MFTSWTTAAGLAAGRIQCREYSTVISCTTRTSDYFVSYNSSLSYHEHWCWSASSAHFAAAVRSMCGTTAPQWKLATGVLVVLFEASAAVLLPAVLPPHTIHHTPQISRRENMRVFLFLISKLSEVWKCRDSFWLLLGIYLQKSDQSNQATLTITLLTAHEHTTITIFTLFYTILPHDRQLRGKPVRTFFTWIQRSQRTQKGQFRLLSGGAHRSRGSIFSNSSCPARRLHPAPNLRTSVGCTHSCRT